MIASLFPVPDAAAATFSPCRMYRYRLMRRVAAGDKAIVAVPVAEVEAWIARRKP